MRKKLVLAAILLVAATLAVAVAYGAWRAHGVAAAASAHDHGAVSHVTVHGRWTLVVKAHDGRVVARRRFENSLQNSGKSDLQYVLSHQAFQGLWGIRLTGSPSPCDTTSPTDPDACMIREPGPSTVAWATYYPDAPQTVELTTTFGTLHFSGTVVANRTGTIDHVETEECFALGSTSGDQCNNMGPFSGTGVASTPVQSGQQVLVTVDLSFS